jgi:hypothetical protein
MLDWLKRHRRWPMRRQPEVDLPIATFSKPPARMMSGKYLLLYKYLNERYANTVVLTFAEIEDLLGFPLPEQARLHQEWWTDAAVNPAGRDHSDSWTLASRTATPNMSAQSVAFDRAA